MHFTEIFIRRPVLSTVLGAFMLLLGFQAFFSLPIREYLDKAYSTMKINIAHRFSDAEQRLSSAAGSLQNLSPLTVLSRGFAVCRDDRGKMVKDSASLKEHQKIGISFRDGHADAEILKISKDELTGAR